MSLWICHAVKADEVDFTVNDLIRCGAAGPLTPRLNSLLKLLFSNASTWQRTKNLSGAVGQKSPSCWTKFDPSCLKVCSLQPGSEICVSWRTVDVVPSCCGKWHADCTESLRSCLIRSRIRFLASLQTQHSERSNTRGRGRGKGTGEEGWGWEWCGGQILA